MSATERLYYADSHLTEFTATVTGLTDKVSGWTGVVLDRTAFYPTGGGQPSDTGRLDGAAVIECLDQGDAGVVHLIRGAAPQVGTTVTGRVDWVRRLDHIQQHTGQHILSQAFVQLFQAPTKGFRVLEHWCEIDVELADPSDVRIERAVALANEIVWADRPLTIRNVTSDEAAALPLRKESAREGELRLIEIEGFDLTPCGGTHAQRTGEVGLIAIRHWSRAKGMTRIEFVAGNRALRDYDLANESARAAAAHFSVGRDDIPQAVERVIAENKELQRRLRTVEENAARFEAVDLASRATAGPGSSRIVTALLADRSVDSLKILAHALAAEPGMIVLLGSEDDDGARIVFARSVDLATDMSALLREAATQLGGRGGGRPDFAQGGGPNRDLLETVLNTVRSAVESSNE
jgi:alanyl-tRNA synthetase